MVRSTGDRMVKNRTVPEEKLMAKPTLKTTDLGALQPLMQAGIRLPAKISWDSFKADEEIRAAKVAEYRNFADGEHDVELSEEMKDMLRSDTLQLNHCENILETLSDRLRLSGITVSVSNEEGEPDEAATDAGNKWLQKLTKQWNRLDGLQIDLHDAIPRDGMSFILAEYDNVRKQVRWTIEEAFDGHRGVIVIWGDDGQTPTMAIKVWHETQRKSASSLVDNVRFNLYFEDRIEKYISPGGGALTPYVDEDGNHKYEWKMKNRKPIGLPVIPFVYKGRRYNKHGLGRLENVIPVQRTVNRENNSIIMAGENLGFPIRYILGGKFPAKIKPGTTIEISIPDTVPTSDGKTKILSADEKTKIMEAITKIQLGQLEAAPLRDLMDEREKSIVQMYIISGTPYPEGVGANISGEALKQLEIRLVGTGKRCQTGWGNSYEDLVNLSARIEATYGKGEPWPLDSASVTAKWESVEIRDDSKVIANVKSTTDIIPSLDVRTRLEMLAPVHGWDNAKVDEIEKRINQAVEAALDAELARSRGGDGASGGFSAFGTGTDLGQPQKGSIELGDPLNPTGSGNGQPEPVA
jgi:hypothetical protein